MFVGLSNLLNQEQYKLKEAINKPRTSTGDLDEIFDAKQEESTPGREKDESLRPTDMGFSEMNFVDAKGG